MKHRIKKIKFRSGKDANEMLMRKLAVNFMASGRLKTTKEKAKALKSHLERLLTKSKKETEANKNYLLKKIGSQALVYRLFKEIGPAIKEKTSGFLRLTSMGQRLSDGAEIVRIEWTLPVVASGGIKQIEKDAVKK